MATLEVMNKSGKAAGKVELGPKLTEATASHTSIHRAVVAEEANKRQGTQSAKTRSEVSGGGRKPYKQKKTGNARQGSTRSPHYAHGGMALAVKPRGYEKQINKRERRAAILTAFASHVASGNVIIAESIVFAEPKTKDAIELLAAVGLKDARRLLVILPAYDSTTFKSFRNLPNVTVRTAPSSSAGGAEAEKTQAFSTRDLLVATNVLVAKDALAKIEEVWAK
jgi:large subunit ribosomal protein L4